MAGLPELRFLKRDEVAGLLPGILEQIGIVERVYRSMAAGHVELPPKPGIHPREDAFIHAMPAYLADDDVAALKWVGGNPENKRRDAPYLSGVIVLNDPETAFPLAIMDASEITAARTAAASGACVRRWAPKGWQRAVILGCGEQARYHARVLDELNPGVKIVGYDPHPERVELLEGNVDPPAPDARTAVEGADVVISSAPIAKSPEPVITTEWLGERWLALPIDFDASFQSEPSATADLFVTDDVDQFEAYRTHGHFTGWAVPRASVGAALDQEPSGERVLCCNLGVGALDAAFAAIVLDQARERRVGRRLTL